MARRRWLFLFLAVGTALAATTGMGWLLAGDGWGCTDVVLLACFTMTTPWVVIGFWNSAIGLRLLAFDRDWVRRILPIEVDETSPLTTRTAIVMPVFNESPERVFAHLAVVADSLARATRRGVDADDAFELHLLSDTTDPDILAAEAHAVHNWQSAGHGLALHYRHRIGNVGYKAGNLRAFCEDACIDGRARFDFMLVLDADSVMSGTAITRMVRTMQANEGLGILQMLTVGLPSASAFARVFQFGMRHAMRPYTVGSAWWQGDHGPYWGHNAVLRMQPFVDHCKLPHIPGSGPLSGPVLSHDQLEATLMRAAGYEVRVLPIEDGSFEENPPTLLEFVKRDLRWCQGNLQYLWLLRMPGLKRLGRLQLLLAIGMYSAAPAWLAFLLVGLASVSVGSGGTEPGAFALVPAAQFTLGLALFGAMITMNLAPKLFGLAHVLLDPARRRSWGGTFCVLATGLAEALFSLLLGPVMAVLQTVFIGGLLTGRRVGWTTQTRDGHRVALDEALRALWLPTLIGCAVLCLLLQTSPALLPWAAPMLVAWLGCIPLACISAEPAVGAWLKRLGAFATPEERRSPVEIRMLGLVEADDTPLAEASLAAARSD